MVVNRYFIVTLSFAVLLLPSAVFGQTDAPVASFQVQPSTGPAAGGNALQNPLPPGASQDAAPENSGGPLMSFNFRFAPWEDVLKLFAETAGLTLDLNDVPPGTFNYYDTGKYSTTEALDILNGYLLPRGHALVRRDKFLVSLNIANGIPPNLVPKVAAEELPHRGNNELLTVVFALQGASAEQTAAEVSQLLGPQGKAVALKASNSLVVTDIGSNLRMVDRLLKAGAIQPPPASSNGPAFRAFTLQHISANEAERLVRGLFGMSPIPAAAVADSAPPAGRGATVQMTAEPRTNSLLVTALAGDLQIIGQMLQAADVDVAASGDLPAAVRFRNTVEVVPLNGADAARIGRALGSLSPRIRVSTTGGGTAASGESSVPREPPSTESPASPATPQPAPQKSNGDNPEGR